jgi:sugar/nucleoside kinase (ribokinase family)
MTRTSTAKAKRRGYENAVDYLIIGHVTSDLTPLGPRLGGTAAYAGLTARALGRRVGLVTACASTLDLSPLSELSIQRQTTSSTTTFENRTQADGRLQILSARSDVLTLDLVPPAWRQAPIVHLAPVADEIPQDLLLAFRDSFVGLTPQGWWRTWDDAGRVKGRHVDDALARLGPAHCVVFSRWDLDLNAEELGRLRELCQIAAITDGAHGADIYWGDHQAHVAAPATPLVDDTGAGDVFAAAFFIQLEQGRSPAEAADEATRWASMSVQHAGLDWIREQPQAELQAGAPRP